MGGLGSGKQSYQRAIEDSINLDIRFLKKHGYLSSGEIGTLRWTSGINNTVRATITFQVFSSHIQLHYLCKPEQYSNYKDIKQEVEFDETHCNYGGYRKWFLCPICSKRVTTLFLLSTHFICRHCNKLPYRSNLESHSHRVFQKKHKLGRMIFEHYESGNGYGKKKGMHWKTFRRLHKEYQELSKRTHLETDDLLKKLYY